MARLTGGSSILNGRGQGSRESSKSEREISKRLLMRTGEGDDDNNDFYYVSRYCYFIQSFPFTRNLRSYFGILT